MHQSFETNAPLVWGSTGDSRGNVLCFYLPEGLAVRSECGGFVFVPKLRGYWYIPGCGGIWQGTYQPLVPAGQFYLGLARPKSPRYSPDQGGAVVTIDWCIMIW